MRIHSTLLFLASLLLALGFAVSPAHAQPSIPCENPQSVPMTYLDALGDNDTFDGFSPDQCLEALQIAIEACLSAVKTAAACNNAYFDALARSQQSLCTSLPTDEQKSCINGAKESLKQDKSVIKGDVLDGNTVCESEEFVADFGEICPLPGA
jgi:hypothetical protein